MRRRRLQRTAGMTLIEVMIVVIIMALIATAVGMAVIPIFIGTQEKSARNEIATVRSAAQAWFLNESGCPSVVDLVDGQYLDSQTRREDPWGTPYEVECEGHEINVRSAGPDETWDTEDDIDGAVEEHDD